MAYEIWKEAVVTRDGAVLEGEETYGHKALLDAGGGVLEIRLATHRENVAYIRIAEPDADGDAGVLATDLVSAVADLRRLSPFNQLSSEDEARQERAAQVVERVCEFLEGDGDPVADTLATDLRTTFLDLEERARHA